MALHLNLYHEIAREKRAKRRDPLKLSLFAVGFIAACFAAYYLMELSAMSTISRELVRKQAEFESMEPQANAAKKHEEELASALRLSETFVQRIEGRFYWAPVLEQITKLVPREVQIVKMVGDVQGERVKKASVTLDGISAGSDPRRVAEELRTSIAEEFGKTYKNVSSTFRSLEDGTDLVKLDGKMAPTATFAINVQLTAGEEAAETPAARTAKTQ